MLPVTVVRSVSAIRYVLPVSWMTSCFRIMVEIARIKDDAYISSSSPGGGTDAKYAVSLTAYCLACNFIQ